MFLLCFVPNHSFTYCGHCNLCRVLLPVWLPRRIAPNANRSGAHCLRLLEVFCLPVCLFSCIGDSTVSGRALVAGDEHCHSRSVRVLPVRQGREKASGFPAWSCELEVCAAGSFPLSFALLVPLQLQNKPNKKKKRSGKSRCQGRGKWVLARTCLVGATPFAL